MPKFLEKGFRSPAIDSDLGFPAVKPILSEIHAKERIPLTVADNLLKLLDLF
jgi:hypothetical protein